MGVFNEFGRCCNTEVKIKYRRLQVRDKDFNANVKDSDQETRSSNYE